ncbi:protein SHORT HYPOCOTYL IN WHITE LIGHT 1-like [Andrographis paniculata]|uniref:protein SHORT HYPOCOTYL IN WHITE LIGHT 1-like n=1 Tax=Andrographis paniculata TaxID=175694 RepID=UPI0021E87DC4|nr:protein SHORT HYPOCOTYL IN WHITE LIGHT 1-like [Andrographis paniculata]
MTMGSLKSNSNSSPQILWQHSQLNGENLHRRFNCGTSIYPRRIQAPPSGAMAAISFTLHTQPPPQTLSSHRLIDGRLSGSTALQLGRNDSSTASICLQKGREWIHEPRAWSVNARSGMVMGDYGDEIDDDDDDDDDEEEDEDRSLDLLIKFVENVFRKVSKRARKAVKSVLPVPISTRLVGFAVNGTIILTFLWVLKAFLQVICTLGSVVFASILLIRGIWTGISYFQDSRSFRGDDDDTQPWASSQPAL